MSCCGVGPVRLLSGSARFSRVGCPRYRRSVAFIRFPSNCRKYRSIGDRFGNTAGSCPTYRSWASTSGEGLYAYADICVRFNVCNCHKRVLYYLFLDESGDDGIVARSKSWNLDRAWFTTGGITVKAEHISEFERVHDSIIHKYFTKRGISPPSDLTTLSRTETECVSIQPDVRPRTP